MTRTDGGPTHGSLRRSELIERTKAGGAVETLLVQQWVVSTFARWECEYRPSLAKLPGVAPKAVKSELFGELRLLRHDIVHHGGVVSSANAGNCSLIDTFAAGDIVTSGAAHFQVIMKSLVVEIVPPA
jgi:hypothetical protein